MSKYTDHSGEIINNYEILSLDKEYELIRNSHDHRKWICRRILCGNIRTLEYRNIKYSKCFCSIIEENKKKLLNMDLGRLTLQSFAYAKNKAFYWNCLCECGKQKIYSTAQLTSGKSRSCGCLQKEAARNNGRKHLMIDMTNYQIDDWIVIEEAEKPKELKRNGTYWKVKCLKCGEEKILSGTDIRRRKTMKCSQNCHSLGEIDIANILKENNIKFSQEKRFSHLVSEQNNFLRFDFAVYDKNDKLNYLIEFQGEQHYAPVEWWGGEKGFEILKKHDKLKKEFCFKNNIPLIIIPYSQYKKGIKIKDLLLETSTFLDKRGENND